MERCPCCMARLTGTVFCPRCQADLGGVISSEQAARRNLLHAVRFWFEREPLLAMQMLVKSLRMKQTPMALIFGRFIARRQVPEVLALLAKNNFSEAKQRLVLLRELQPENEFLAQLQGFTGFLLAEQDGHLHKLLSQ
ncbi:MAG: hypothetical protein RI893_489 [Pseudomonadota bacterium]